MIFLITLNSEHLAPWISVSVLGIDIGIITNIQFYSQYVSKF